jgi:Ca2+-binding RTX toxin-like protein
MGHQLVGTWVLGAIVALAVVAPAQAATSYPAGGSDFTVDAQGWVGSGASCNLGGGVICTASVQHEAGAGNPPGSVAVSVDVTVNLLGLPAGLGTWTSPSFTVPAGQAVTGATFAYDRQFAAGGLVSLNPVSTVTVDLVDQAGGSVTLLSEQLTTADAAFATRGVGAPSGTVREGHTYHLRIQTGIGATAESVGVLGQAHTRFDNVVLAVDQTAPGEDDGGSTPVVSEGVRVVKGLRTDAQIGSLFNRFDETTEVGRVPGGSLVPLAECTIIGTSRADRIKGTSGNDVICGLGGKDVIDGAGGIDLVDGASGSDRVSGGSARDKLIGLRGADRLNGKAGNDLVGGGAGRDRVSGAAGADRLSGGGARDRILGGAGKDRIAARDRRRDVVDGGKGRDRATVDRLGRGARRTRSALRRVDRVRRVEIS